MANLYRVSYSTLIAERNATGTCSFKLVRARSRAAAERFVAGQLLTSRLANFSDGLEAAQAGVAVEDSEPQA